MRANSIWSTEANLKLKSSEELGSNKILYRFDNLCCEILFLNFENLLIFKCGSLSSLIANKHVGEALR